MIKSVKAYAKINLFLDMHSLREDGYHNIISLMQSIDLHDTVTVSYDPSEKLDINISCSDKSVPCNEKNLAYKAAKIFPISSGKIMIDIEKRIPMQAGLAGGSADAAATLIALNQLTGNNLSEKELKALGARLGADVPFCIETGAAIAQGTGDILEQTVPMPKFPIIVARMGEGMSTPEAYHALDVMYNNFSEYAPKTQLLDILITMNDQNDIKKYSEGLFNIFESVVEPCRPCVAQLKDMLMKNGAIKAMMSGSGTSVFGIFEQKSDAEIAMEAIRNIGAVSHLCYPISKK